MSEEDQFMTEATRVSRWDLNQMGRLRVKDPPGERAFDGCFCARTGKWDRKGTILGHTHLHAYGGIYSRLFGFLSCSGALRA